MVRSKQILGAIEQTKVISILRGIETQHLGGTLQALYDGGIRCVEITMNTPDACTMIRKARKEFEGKLFIGAGTVLEQTAAKEAIGADAQFVLAPTLDPAVIQVCNEYDVLPVPGIFTPTEALSAVRDGAKLLKVFPASTGGPTYIKDLLGPMEWLKLLAVGGVTLENTAAFLQAGAVGVGVGGALCSAQLANKGAYEEIRARAAAFIAVAQG